MFGRKKCNVPAPESYSMHVEPSTGIELRFDGVRPEWYPTRPNMEVLSFDKLGVLPVHYVEVFGDYEETSIRSVLLGPGTMDDGTEYHWRIVHPKPHGRGWVLHYAGSDKHQTFRRPLPDARTQRRITIVEFEQTCRKAGCL
jgi:hypothetical protein